MNDFRRPLPWALEAYTRCHLEPISMWIRTGSESEAAVVIDARNYRPRTVQGGRRERKLEGFRYRRHATLPALGGFHRRNHEPGSASVARGVSKGAKARQAWPRSRHCKPLRLQA